MYHHPSAFRTSTPAHLAALLRNRAAIRDAFAGTPTRQRWLVPIDGTPVSMLAVEHVIAHADSAGTCIHLLNVQRPIMAGDVSVLASARLVADLRRAAANGAVRDAKRLLDQHGFEYSCELVLGAPAEAIVRTAEERGCTKIVMGARHTSGLARIMRRSVSSRVIRLSRVTVTIVKSGGALRGRSAKVKQ